MAGSNFETVKSCEAIRGKKTQENISKEENDWLEAHGGFFMFNFK